MTRDASYKDCTIECERVHICMACDRPKPPIGRDVAAAMSGHYCERECPGHNQGPRSHLWPGELARMDEAAKPGEEKT